MRKTKIICTIGPASESEDMIRELCKAGMNVARLNFSHGSHEEHKARVETIKKVRTELNLPIAIMLDTKGPEYRIGVFENHKVELHEGDKFTLTTNEIIGDNTKVSVSYKNLAKELNIGDTILVNNGLIELKVENTTAEEIKCEVIIGGVLSDRKSMAFPGRHIHQEYLSEKDKEDL
ncbi:MAG: pyruvate kinase, partial [Lachnospiraceae bacterium]